MRMSVLLYDGFTTLDIVGGYESLARIPNMQTEFVAKEVGIYAADTRALRIAGRQREQAIALTARAPFEATMAVSTVALVAALAAAALWQGLLRMDGVDDVVKQIN